MLSTAKVLIRKQCLNLIRETIEKKAEEEKVSRTETEKALRNAKKVVEE